MIESIKFRMWFKYGPLHRIHYVFVIYTHIRLFS